MGVRLLEHLENPREDIGHDSDPRIADAHHSLSGLLVRGEPDLPATRRELHRIVENVRKDLHEPRAVTVDTNRRRRHTHVQLLVRGRRERHDGLDGSGHQALEFVRFTTQVDLIGSDPGHIQEVIDEPHELPNLTVNHFTGPRRARQAAWRP